MSEISTFPTEGMDLTQILVVTDLDRSRAWYVNVLGAELYREYGGTSAVLTFAGTWILLVTGGEPTADKPTVTFAAPCRPRRRWPRDDDPGTRLPGGLRDRSASRGATFLTPPYDWVVRRAASFAIPTGISSRSAKPGSARLAT